MAKAPTTLTIGARSPYLRHLGAHADVGPWEVGEEATVEAALQTRGGCSARNATMEIRNAGEAGFDKSATPWRCKRDSWSHPPRPAA